MVQPVEIPINDKRHVQSGLGLRAEQCQDTIDEYVWRQTELTLNKAFNEITQRQNEGQAVSPAWAVETLVRMHELSKLSKDTARVIKAGIAARISLNSAQQ